jgi:transcriptional regulator with XRE-family HTH domain
MPRLPCHIRQLRNAAKLSLTQLANETKIPLSDLSLIERGMALPSDEQLAPLERELGKPATTFWPLRTVAGFTSDREWA